MHRTYMKELSTAPAPSQVQVDTKQKKISWQGLFCHCGKERQFANIALKNICSEQNRHNHDRRKNGRAYHEYRIPRQKETLLPGNFFSICAGRRRRPDLPENPFRRFPSGKVPPSSSIRIVSPDSFPVPSSRKIPQWSCAAP